MKLSIIIPAFNEEETIAEILRRISDLPLDIEKEIIVVDDGSKDRTREILEELKKSLDFTLLVHSENKGKGAAIKTGIKPATGELIIIQDADLEYDPNDYPVLIEPFLNKGAKVVYGSRNLQKNEISSIGFYLGGRFLTLAFNLLYGAKITDVNTCYKVFQANILKNEIELKEDNFNFCEEVSAKVVRKGHQIMEVPIRYYPRNKKEGKKLYWVDGLRGLWAIVKYRVIE
ncbi:glycosyltransferase family 2 protein [Patescibacteria group bacterium]|nr:glycosyltransferase family 2 protein [Patescibacteria group bacterium]